MLFVAHTVCHIRKEKHKQELIANRKSVGRLSLAVSLSHLKDFYVVFLGLTQVIAGAGGIMFLG